MDLHYKQEVTVGALVLLGVALFIGGSMWLGGHTFSRAPTVTIGFADASTLKRGSPVKVSGVQLGTVEGVEFQSYGKVLVHVNLDPQVKPRRDASALLGTIGLVGDAVVHFNPGSAAEPLPAGAIVPGTLETGLAAAGTDLAARAKDVMAGVQDVVNKRLADDLSRTLAAMRRMADLYGNGDTGPSAELTRTLKEVQRMGARLDTVLGEARLAGSLRKADSLIDALGDLSSSARGTAQRLDTLLAKVNRGEGTLGRFVTDSTFYANAQRAVKSLQDLVDDLRKHPGKLGVTVRVF